MEKTVKKIRILIADDHTLVREGLVNLLSLSPDFEIVGEANDGKQCINLAFEKHPDVILMDLSMPNLNGIEATHLLKKRLPQTKILVLSGFDDDDHVIRVIQNGADGYLKKQTSMGVLQTAIRSVNDGKKYFDPSVSSSMIERLTKPHSADHDEAGRGLHLLTSREREILQLIAEGQSHVQIADRLNISVRTVDTHRNNIMKKLDIHDTASLVMFAIRNGIVILPR